MLSDTEQQICDKITEGRGSNVVFDNKEDLIGFISGAAGSRYSYSVTLLRPRRHHYGSLSRLRPQAAFGQ
jgi:hypothetical protein